jgi:hypothetical protein
MPSSERTRANDLRDRAEKIRTEAAQVPNLRVRASMLKIATAYDNTAEILDRMMAEKSHDG